MDNKQRREENFAKLNKELKSRRRAEKTRPLGVVVATLAILLAIVGGIYLAATWGDDDTTEAENAASTESTTPETDSETPDVAPLPAAVKTPYGDTVTCDYRQEGQAAKPVDLPQTENVPATGTVNLDLKLSQGDVPLTLDRAKSPCTVNAIEHLAKAGYYNDTTCHRMTTNGIYVLQCGDPSGSGAGGPGFKFDDEFPTNSVTDEEKSKPMNYARGTLAMANAGPGTNGSQFFLVYKDSPLPPNYNVFGSISDAGLGVIDGIADKGVDDPRGDGKPKEEVKIESATAN